MQDHKGIRIGTICHSYGYVSVKVENGRPYWGVCDGRGMCWEEIPDSLYEELVKFNDEAPVDVLRRPA